MKLFVSLFVIFYVAYFTILYRYIELKFPNRLIIINILVTSTYAIQAPLPIYLSVCCFVTLIRLKFKGISGIDPNRIIEAGVTKMVCFDKTGTLTTTFIDV